MFFRKKKEVSLFRSVSFEGMTAASLQQHHDDDDDDDDVDFMTEVHCLLDNFYEWLFVAIRLDFLWLVYLHLVLLVLLEWECKKSYLYPLSLLD